MSSDQLTYVLVALLVTGLAILLLLVGAFAARRGSRAVRAAPASAGPGVVAGSAPPAYEPPPAAEPVAIPPDVAVAPLPVTTELAAAPTEEEPEPEPEPEPAAAPDTTAPADEPLAVTAADLAAAARRVHDPREEEIIEGFLSISPRRREVAAAEAGRPPTAVAPAGRAAAAEAGAVPAPASGVASSTAPGDPYVDDVTGLDSRAAWDRAVAEENARYVRYRRPVSVVVGELDGLLRFEDQFGAEAARRVLRAVGDAMRRGARRTDVVAHAGGGRFLVLMPETDEIQAINYVERVRGECERWLAAGSAALRLSMGWASPSAVGELDTALRTAEERMYAERRRAARAGSGEPGPSR